MANQAVEIPSRTVTALTVITTPVALIMEMTAALMAVILVGMAAMPADAIVVAATEEEVGTAAAVVGEAVAAVVKRLDAKRTDAKRV